MSGYQVGQYGYLCVGVGGTVTEVADGFVAIEGIRLPLSLSANPAIRYLSAEPPPSATPDEPECSECDERGVEADRFLDLLHQWHDAEHGDPWSVCSARYCREARR